MGIDGIGKGGPPKAPETSGSGPLEKTGSVEKTFSVDRPDATTRAQGPQALDATSPLARLRAGEIGADAYLDLKAEDATKGLEGLSPAELDDIKKVLRDQMTTDPELVDLVRMITGQAPKVPEE
ncbi:MAG TPA: hypothetical protein VM925_37605 [Labilithrix sp.]|nr:hypothetical protein [Labilithrix sp.]